MNTITQKKRDIKNKTMKGGTSRRHVILVASYNNIHSMLKNLLTIITQQKAISYITDDINSYNNLTIDISANVNNSTQLIIPTVLNNDPISTEDYNNIMIQYNWIINNKHINSSVLDKFNAYNYIIRDKTEERIDYTKNALTKLTQDQSYIDNISKHRFVISTMIFQIIEKLNLHLNKQNKNSILLNKDKYLKLNDLIQKFSSLNSNEDNYIDIKENLLKEFFNIKVVYKDIINTTPLPEKNDSLRKPIDLLQKIDMDHIINILDYLLLQPNT
jgi:hypothetical protein